MVMAGIVTLLGVAIMAMGQITQGAIFTGVGAVITVAAYIAQEGDITQAGATQEVAAQKATEVAAASGVGGLLGGMGAANLQGGKASFEYNYKEKTGYNEYMRDKAEAERDRDQAEDDSYL